MVSDQRCYSHAIRGISSQSPRCLGKKLAGVATPWSYSGRVGEDHSGSHCKILTSISKKNPVTARPLAVLSGSASPLFTWTMWSSMGNLEIQSDISRQTDNMYQPDISPCRVCSDPTESLEPQWKWSWSILYSPPRGPPVRTPTSSGSVATTSSCWDGKGCCERMEELSLSTYSSVSVVFESSVGQTFLSSIVMLLFVT